MRKFDLIIFDWAGTTVDYGCYAPVLALEEAFKKHGLTPTQEELRKPMGMGKWDHVKTMLAYPRLNQAWEEAKGSKVDDRAVDAIYASFNEKILEELGKKEFSRPKPYVVETVEKLRAAGYKIGGTSGYTKEMMDLIIPGAKDQGYTVDWALTSEDVGGLGRPYPYMIFKLMAHFKIEGVSRVLKVGDTVADIKEAKNAGVRAAGIIEGSSVVAMREADFNQLNAADQVALKAKAEKEFKEAGADLVFQNFADLYNYLK
ncbi:phosphonoacetaldehyde hydrolase [Peptococcus simiae]|uniref:phosphonoacetaldehyde hydrolase n=1 Tax=Peptococcus simiae TaxID=1643805 RepID=UPI00397E9970